MPYTDILNVVLPTFIAILIGYLIGKFIRLDITGIIEIIFYVGLPALAFVSILNQQIILLDALKVWATALTVSLGCGAMGWLLFKALRTKHSGLYLPISLPNTVNIPFPIMSLAYGPAGLFAATLYYIPNLLTMYSAGVFIAAGKSMLENLKIVLKVPTLYTAVLALILNLFHVGVPALIVKPLDFIGSMVTPAVVLTLGYSLAKVKLNSFPITLWSSLIRLGGGLAIGLLMVNLFHLTGVLRSVVVIMSAMPAAANTFTIAAKYKNEAELVASVVLVTTVISIILIPFLLHVLG